MRAALADAVKRTDDRAILVGYSGGLDSSVLLHLLADDADARRNGLRALHVHHGLHADADAWAAHCERTCASLDVPLQVVRVEVERDAGLGLEGAARTARHRAFAEALGEDEILALAHHLDDQAETFLLRALRGSGVDGLGAMWPWRAYAGGWLWRPLLDSRRVDLHEHALALGLSWVEDASNAATDLDRNFLRNCVLPLLAERWPHAGGSLARSAELAAQGAMLLDRGDTAISDASRTDDGDLDLGVLQAHPAERRARVLRRWIADRGLPPLPAIGIEAIERQLLAARPDAEACFDWAGARVQRWRNLLHAETIRAPLSLDWSRDWDGSTPLALPTGDTLALVGVAHFDAPLRVHARRGGERIVQPGRKHSHALKHVLQESAMPPWIRARLPLLSTVDGEVLAAGDALLSARMAAWLQARGARLQWTRVA